jgi:hypothetical protein
LPMTRKQMLPMFVLTALVLSSCIKVDMDMKLGKNEKINGKAIVGIKSSTIELMGQKKDDFFKEMEKDNSSLPKSVKAKRYDKDGFIGQELTFKDLPASEFSKVSSSTKSSTGADSGSSADDIKLVKKGDTWVLTGTLDFATDGIGTENDGTDAAAMKAILKDFQVRVKMEFPGKILEHDKFAKIKGNTAEWKPKAGEKVVMRIVAKAS